MKKNVIIITGASSGIGREFVKQLDEGLFSVDEFWLISRREEALTQIAEDLNHVCKILPLDLQKESSIYRLKQVIDTEKPAIRMLINAAGFGLMGKFSEMELEDSLDMIRLNCEALTAITRICIPYMPPKARIIQMASSAAFVPQANFSIYAATKSYVLSFTRSLNMELRKKQIYCTAVCPGPVDTAFFERAEKNGNTLKIKKLSMVSVDSVVRDALRASAAKKDITVYSLLMKSFAITCKLMPHYYFLRFMQLMERIEK